MVSNCAFVSETRNEKAKDPGQEYPARGLFATIPIWSDRPHSVFRCEIGRYMDRSGND